MMGVHLSDWSLPNSISSILRGCGVSCLILSLLGLDDRLDDGDYDKCRKEISQFSFLVSRIQSTYDKLFKLLMNHLLEHYEYEIPGLTSEPDFEDEDVDDKMEDYEHFEDSDDFEMFIHALMRKGQSFYSKLLQSDDPFSLLTDMMEERGEEFCIEGMQFPGECGYRIDCIDDGLLIDTMYEDDDYQEKATELIEYLEDEGGEEATIIYELETNNFSTHQYEDMHYDLMGNIEDRLDDCDPLRLMSKICESNLPDDVKDEIYDEFHSAVTEILATKNNRILKNFLDGLK